MAIRPLHDRVLLERVESETTSAGGIILPDAAQEKPQEAVVVAVGTGYHSEDGKVRPLDVKKGDRVMFAQWGGTEVKSDGKDYLILKESDILAIVE